MAYPKNCFIIDIGNEQIKFADLTRNGDSVKVNEFAVIQTPDDIMNDGAIMDKLRLSAVMKPVLKEHKFKNKNVIFTITSSKIITREVDFPDVKPSKLKNLIQMNASEYFPVNLNDYILAYEIIDKVYVDGENKLKLNIIAALMSIVDEYVALAKLLGLRIIGIDYTGNSLTQFAKHEKIEGTCMLLDIGSESTMVSIMVNGTAKFSRNLMFGTNLLLDCIKNHFEVDKVEAIRISKERPLLTSDSDDNPYLSNDITAAMNQILNGVSRLLDYYSSRNQEKVERIYLVGGGSTIYGIEEYIDRYFSIPTRKITSFKNVSYRGNRNFNSAEIFFANIIGACYSQINLTPKYVEEKESMHAEQRILILANVLVVAALTSLYFINQGNLNDLEEKKIQLEKDIERANEVTAIKAKYEEAKMIADFRQGIIDNSFSTTEYFVDLLALLERIMPTGVQFLALTENNGLVQVQCIAENKLTVAKFIQVLKDNGMQNVNTPSLNEIVVEDRTTEEGTQGTTQNTNENETGSTVTKEGYITFTLTFTYEGGILDETVR